MTIMKFKELPYHVRQGYAEKIPAGKLRQAYNLIFGGTRGRYYKDNTWHKAALLCGLDEQELREQLTAFVAAIADRPHRPVYARVVLDDVGMTHCEGCGAEIVCNDCGDMPERCPACNVKLSYVVFERS